MKAGIREKKTEYTVKYEGKGKVRKFRELLKARKHILN